MRDINFSWILWYKSITLSQAEKHLVLVNRKKGTCHFAVPAENKVKIKESEKIKKYDDLARELKNSGERVGDDVVIALGTVSKQLEKRLEELEVRRRIETVQTRILIG